MRNNIINLALTLFFIAACSESTVEIEYDIIRPDVSCSDTIVVNVDNPATTSFIDLVDSVKYISLETNADCPIGRIDKILFADSVIVVEDMSTANAVYLFDLDGKFVSRVSGPGNGPHEYLSLEQSNVTLSYDRSMVAIQDRNHERTLWYDLGGNYLRTTQLERRLSGVEYISGNRYLHETDFRTDGVPPVFVMTDSVGEGMYAMENVGYENASFIVSATLGIQGSKIIGLHLRSNSIYEFDSDGPNAVCTIRLLPDDIIYHKYKTLNRYLNASLEIPNLNGNVLVLDNSICFNVSVPHKNNFYIFSRISHKLYHIRNEYDNIHSMIFRQYITCLDNNWLVCSAEPSEIQTVEEWQKFLGRPVSTDDNPILVLYHLKNGF